MCSVAIIACVACGSARKDTTASPTTPSYRNSSSRTSTRSYRKDSGAINGQAMNTRDARTRGSSASDTTEPSPTPSDGESRVAVNSPAKNIQDDTLSGSTNPPACVVVTASDAARVMHRSVVPEMDLSLPLWECLYTTTRSPTSTAAAILQHASQPYLARLFQTRRTDTTSPIPQVVAHLGDEALWDRQNLQVRSGRWLLTIDVKSENTANLTQSIALARLALSQLHDG